MTNEAWFRQLAGERVEVMCKTADRRLRVSGPEAWVWEMVEHFEAATGLAISFDRRPPRRVAQIVGQLPMIEPNEGT